jgi:hypothetical protein
MNLLGTVLFLRMGWVTGEAGISEFSKFIRKILIHG